MNPAASVMASEAWPSTLPLQECYRSITAGLDGRASLAMTESGLKTRQSK